MDGGGRARHADRADHRGAARQRRKSYFTGAFPEFWLFALGGLFIAVTLFFPKGIVGTLQHYLARRREKRVALAAGDAQPGNDSGSTVAQQAAE